MKMQNLNFLPKQLHLPVDVIECVVAAGIAFIIAVIAIQLLLFAQFNIHESGHLTGCRLSAIIRGTSISCAYTNWVDIPLWGKEIILKAPQQTMSGNPGTLLMVIGGPVWSSLFFLSLSLVVWHYLRMKKREFWLIPMSFVLMEFMNVACGTDNMSGQPFQLCSHGAVPFVIQGLPVFAIFVIFWMVYSSLKDIYSHLLGIYLEAMKKAASGGKQ